MPGYNLRISDLSGVHAYTADELPEPGETITPDGTDWSVRVDQVQGTDEGGAIFGGLVDE